MRLDDIDFSRFRSRVSKCRKTFLALAIVSSLSRLGHYLRPGSLPKFAIRKQSPTYRSTRRFCKLSGLHLSLIGEMPERECRSVLRSAAARLDPVSAQIEKARDVVLMIAIRVLSLVTQGQLGVHSGHTPIR